MLDHRSEAEFYADEEALLKAKTASTPSPRWPLHCSRCRGPLLNSSVWVLEDPLLPLEGPYCASCFGRSYPSHVPLNRTPDA